MNKFFTAFLLVLTIGAAQCATAIKTDPTLVSKYIEKLKGQTEVDLRNQNMRDGEAAALAEALLSNKTVHRLNLNFNNIGGEGAAALAEALSFNYILSELYLEENKIRREHATKEHSRETVNGKVIKYTLAGELERNKEIAKLLKIDPQMTAFLVATDKRGTDFWLPKDVALAIAAIAIKAASSAHDFDLGQFVTIPGGAYEIGSPTTDPNHHPNEKLHKIELSPFSIMDAAVTQESYAKVTGDNPSGHKGARYCPLSFKEIEVNGKKISVCADFPVENVTFEDANNFAALLSEQDKKYKYSLPTEAQLEVAFRGGTNFAYVTGRDDETGLKNFVWYCANSDGQNHPVKSTQKNAFNIYRSSVSEWAQDWYDPDYAGSTGLDPKGSDLGSQFRVIRGCGIYDGASLCRSANRCYGLPKRSDLDLGFRLVRTYR